MFLEGLASCAELTTEHAEEAASSSRTLRDLFLWASRVARPGGGAPKLLLAIGQLGLVEWFDGTPFVEIEGTEAETRISIFADDGSGMRERVLPMVRFRVPFDEFARAVRLAPQLAAPLRATHRGDLITVAPADVVEERPRTAITIDDSSLHEQERKTAPPPAALVTDIPPSGDGERTSQVNALDPRTGDRSSSVHTAPTVRRMVAVRPEALRKGGGKD